jgi:uncharacterized repeat protein (TIGR01451 family)
VIYRNIHLAARFAVQHLGLSPSPVDVYAFSPSRTRSSYQLARDSSPAEIVIANSLYNNTGRQDNRPDNREFHEYSHHIMAVSPIGGTGKMPPMHEDTNLNGRLDVGEDTNGNGELDYAESHGGVLNYNSSESWVEGFAEFMSAVISDVMLDRAEKQHPEWYHWIGTIAILDNLYRLDDPDWPGHQYGYFDYDWNREEFVIASLLWDLYDPVDPKEQDFIAVPLPQLWGALSQLNLHFAAVHDSLLNLASNSPTVLDPVRLEKRFIAAGIYDDYALTPGFTNRNNGLYDPGELVGITSWTNTIYSGGWPSPEMAFPIGTVCFLHRTDTPVIGRSILGCSVVDEAGHAVADATLSLETEYDPPYADRNHDAAEVLLGVGPYEVPLHLPPLPARVRIRAHKAGLADSAELVVTRELFREKLDPLRPGGVIDPVMKHTFVLGAAAADLALQATAQPSVSPVGAPLTDTITVTNAGPDAATAVRVTNAFNGPVTLGAVTASRGSCSQAGTVVTCDFGELALGSTATIAIQVVPTDTGLVSNTASVGASESDPVPTNNVVSVAATAVAMPALRFAPTASGAGFELSWPANGVRLVIESAESLAPPILWRPLEISPTRVGDRFVVTIAPTPGVRFFRLRYP